MSATGAGARRVVVGVAGSVSAYKAPTVIRLLRRAGASRTTIVLSALVETAGLQLLGLAIAAITIAVTWAWLAWALVPYYDDLTAPPAVPWLLLIAGTVVALVVPQVVALGAALRAAASGAPPRGAGGDDRGPR